MDLTHVRFQGHPTTRSEREQRAAHRTPTSAEIRVPARPPLSPGDGGGLPAWVLARSGLDPAAYRSGPLARRARACLRAVRAPSEPAARARVETKPELLGTALSAVLIGVSSFFRDPIVFDTLRTTVLGALRERTGPLRVLSLGCSTGDEPYSVAILLAEADLLPRSRLLGVDCRADAVASARGAVFPAEALAGVDAERRARFLEPTASGWRVAEPLRRATSWQVADATRAIPIGPWDLVLCRNLLIYLQPPAAEAMLRRIAGALAPGGFLVVGKAERPPAWLGLAAAGRCVYRKHAG